MYFNARRFSQSEYLCIFHLVTQSPCIFMHFSSWRFNRRVFLPMCRRFNRRTIYVLPKSKKTCLFDFKTGKDLTFASTKFMNNILLLTLKIKLQ